MKTKVITKFEALASHCQLEADAIVKAVNDAGYLSELYCVVGTDEKYLVLTVDEADEKCAEYIKDSLWAFNASFLVNFIDADIPEEIIKNWQETKCEGANQGILDMVGKNFDDLVEDAIKCDGRGHFLGQYDGEENVRGEYYIYRVN